MKKYLLIFIFILILPNAWALKGIGLQWYIESAQTVEGGTICVNYGVYNPWDEDVTIGLVASGEIEQFAEPSDSKLVPAGTSSSNAIPAQVCFKIPRVYDKNCKLGSFMCEHDCSEKKTYEGEISAVERAPKGETKGTGSATTASVAADLKITALCKERGLEWLVFPIIFIISLIGIIIAIKWMIGKGKKEKYKSLYGDLEILRAELESDLQNLEKRKKYEKLWKKLNELRKKL